MIFMPSSLEAKSPRLKANKKSIAAYSKGILARLNSGHLTRFDLSNLGDLPQTAGVYFAVTEDGTVLYVGKANNLAQRCVVRKHHKLSTAIGRGAVYLLIDSVPIELACNIEQWLIGAISPSLNIVGSQRWERPIYPSLMPLPASSNVEDLGGVLDLKSIDFDIDAISDKLSKQINQLIADGVADGAIVSCDRSTGNTRQSFHVIRGKRRYVPLKSVAALQLLIDRGNRARQLENAIGHLEQVRRLISHGN
jgi:hypothetical protein